MRTKSLYRCSKRNLGVVFVNYCDWFEKKRSSLSKRCCKNCRYLTDEELPKKETTRGSKKKTETETKKQKEE